MSVTRKCEAVQHTKKEAFVAWGTPTGKLAETLLKEMENSTQRGHLQNVSNRCLSWHGGNTSAVVYGQASAPYGCISYKDLAFRQLLCIHQG